MATITKPRAHSSQAMADGHQGPLVPSLIMSRSQESNPRPPDKKEEKVWRKGWDRDGTALRPLSGSHWPLGLEAATILSIATSSKLI